MDISKASNLERFVRELFGEDAEGFAERWAELDREGVLDLSDQREALEREHGFLSGTSTHWDRVNTIRAEFEANGVIVDPHTADGLAVARRLTDLPGRILVLETAKPEKFRETIEEALGDRTPPLSAELLELLERPQRTVDIENSAEQLRDYIDAACEQ